MKLKRLVLFVLLCLLTALAFSACSDTSSAPTDVVTPPVAPTPTAKPTTKASTPSGPLAPVSGPTVLGQPLSHFIARYGQPQVMGDGASYDFNNHTVSVFAFKEENYLVSGVLFANADGNGWNSDDSAKAACQQFLPSGAVYKRTVGLGATGYERVYLSQSVAPLFKASDFTDENGNNTTPGTVAIVYTYPVSSGPKILNCSVQVGLQAK